MKRYEGKRTIDGLVVTVDGKRLDEHYDVKRFTKYGFEWTYEGESPQQLALAILFDYLGDQWSVGDWAGLQRAIPRTLPMSMLQGFAAMFPPIDGEQASLVDKLNAAGSVFIGPLSAQSIGDYASGTNHVLPTSGGARTRGGLSTWDFVRCISMQHVSAVGLRSLGPVVTALADAE